MMSVKSTLSLLLLLLLTFTFGCSSSEQANEQAPVIDPGASELGAFGTLPEVVESEQNPITEAKVTLGRILYFDPRLSKAQDISCNTCHQLDKYGVDGKPTSEGHKGVRGTRNSPTVYNAAGHFAQFWDGRAPDVEEQAKGPVLNPVEMAMSGEDHVVEVLKSMPEYEELFQAAFPDDEDPVSWENFARAVGAFERGLITPARWDAFLQGDASVLSVAEQEGLKEFLDAGCHTCHTGLYLGGGMFQKAGLARPWPDQEDTGRQSVTGNDGDNMMFKVPSLRNVAETGPYFHDGSIGSLEEAVKMMAEHELGGTLTEEQSRSIAEFLKTLTGELPADYIREPELPPSTDATPKPDTSE